jgi:predicted site-specific integrase-resolvase
MGNEGNGYVRSGDAAKFLHVSTGTMSRYAKEGYRAADGTLTILPHVRTPGGHRRFEREAVNKLAAELGITERL